MAERVLLTGAGGFVGRAVVAPLLARGVELHAVSRSAARAIPGVTWHRADLLDEAEARALLREVRPTTLLHAAWYVEHGRFWTSPENARWVEASTALAHAFAELGGRRMVGLGTCAEYAEVAADDGEPWPETRALGGGTPYGRAKAELAARLLALSPRLSVAWARLFHLFGEGEPAAKLVPDVALSLLAGREARCGSGRAVRDYASTRFAGRALAALATGGVTGPVNIASGTGRPMREVIEAIGTITGRPDLIRLGARPDPAGEVPFMVADTSRLRREVGFTGTADLHGDLAALVHALRAAPVAA
ncbi:NAD-dependent epimerase/dehydratase family protein [Falsiroseomonas sp. CW058]|uniref:NAD-dependent epimerase/dehydratase family protein n=1 Tax=Falsiroseomonas sp. CW058 TaxID=3388664 RepID=UPI003D318F74